MRPSVFALLLSGCATAAPPPDTTARLPAKAAASAQPTTTTTIKPLGTPFGFSQPFILMGASLKWNWTATCFATRDTDGDGKIEVLVGHHGDTLGDELLPFFFLGNDQAEPIDEFLVGSPDRRFLTFIKNAKVWLVDTADGSRLDLSSLGVSSAQDPDSPLPPPTLTFSDRGQLFFVRADPSGSAVVALDLISRQTEVLYRTAMRVWRLNFSVEDSKLHALELDPKTIEPPTVQTTLAPRRCRGSYASYTMGGTRGPSFTDHPIETPTPRPPFPVEKLYSHSACVDDDRQVLVTGQGDELLVATRESQDDTANRGPLQWVTGKLKRCPPRR